MLHSSTVPRHWSKVKVGEFQKQSKTELIYMKNFWLFMLKLVSL